MKTISKLLAVTVASAVLSTAAYADRVVKRITHPNGPATFAYVPAERADNFGDENVTIAEPYSRQRMIIVPGPRVVVPVDADLRRFSYQERREVIYTPAERW